jgi:hypothetical protein
VLEKQRLATTSNAAISICEAAEGARKPEAVEDLSSVWRMREACRLQQSRHNRCVIDRQKRREDPMFLDPTVAKKYPNPMQNNGIGRSTAK